METPLPVGLGVAPGSGGPFRLVGCMCLLSQGCGSDLVRDGVWAEGALSKSQLWQRVSWCNSRDVLSHLLLP